MTGSRLYFGSVLHRRLRPRVHQLRYRVFWALIELEELPELARRNVLFSHNRFNILSFHDSDHGDGTRRPLRPQLERTLSEHGIDFDGGAIRLLCMPLRQALPRVPIHGPGDGLRIQDYVAG
jgi:DUF1365 family protein